MHLFSINYACLYYTLSIDCGTSYSIQHGEVDFAGQETTYGSTLAVSCNSGYELHGKENVVCGPDGTWSKLSSCHIKGILSVFHHMFCIVRL